MNSDRDALHSPQENIRLTAMAKAAG